MRTIRRLIYREGVRVGRFVAVGFLALFFFFDFVDELPNVGKGAGAATADAGAGLRDAA
jgi:lipopolysaccharide export system permease protein